MSTINISVDEMKMGYFSNNVILEKLCCHGLNQNLYLQFFRIKKELTFKNYTCFLFSV
jgi:hypothetical protein